MSLDICSVTLPLSLQEDVAAGAGCMSLDIPSVTLPLLLQEDVAAGAATEADGAAAMAVGTATIATEVR